LHYRAIRPLTDMLSAGIFTEKEAACPEGIAA